MTDTCAAVLVDEIHPLVEHLGARLAEKGVRARLVHWKELVVEAVPDGSRSLYIEALSGARAVYIDRLAEDEHCHVTQLELLALWAEENGVPFVNDPRSYWYARDKALTAAQLARAGVETPHTRLCYTPAQVKKVMSGTSADSAVAVKSLLGVCSDEVLIAYPGELSESDVERITAHDGAAVVQDFVDNPQRFIWRVDVVDAEAIVVNRRYSYNADGPPLCNGTYGGRIEFVDPASPEAAGPVGLAVRATRALGLSVSGVDIAVDGRGRTTVLEVNPEPDITVDGTGVRGEFPAAIAESVRRRIADRERRAR